MQAVQYLERKIYRIEYKYTDRVRKVKYPRQYLDREQELREKQKRGKENEMKESEKGCQIKERRRMRKKKDRE